MNVQTHKKTANTLKECASYLALIQMANNNTKKANAFAWPPNKSEYFCFLLSFSNFVYPSLTY